MNLLFRMNCLPICLLLLVLRSQADGSINYDKPLSIQIENLTHWKNSAEAQAVQQGLVAMTKARSCCPRAPEVMEDLKRFEFLYSQPFLLLEAEPNGFGGFWGVVVFYGYPRVFGLWLYDIDRDGTGWEIRSVKPFKFKIPKIILEQLTDDRVDPFWLNRSNSDPIKSFNQVRL